jgi:predicted Zn-dependent protease
MQRIVAAAPSSPEAQDAASFLALTNPEQNADPRPALEPQISKILQLTPDYAPALMARARLRMKSGDPHGAQEDYAAVLRHFPDFPLAQKYLALLQFQDPATEATAYDLAVKAHNTLPQDPEISQMLAQISYRRKDYSYAVRLLRESADTRPLDTKSLYYLGMSLWETKAKPESRDALQRAVDAGLSEPLLSDANRVLAELKKK